MARQNDKGVWYGEVFVKSTITKHYFAKHGGYAVDKYKIDNSGCNNGEVVLVLRDTQQCFSVDIDKLIENATVVNYAGYGQQYVLSMKYWKAEDTDKVVDWLGEWGMVMDMKKRAG